MITLTQKERMLLEDQKSQEELCIKKYSDYSNQAQDPQLKQLCQSLAQQEQQHLDTINQLLSGQVPQMNQQQQGSQQQNQQQQSNQQQNQQQQSQQQQSQQQQSNQSNQSNQSQSPMGSAMTNQKDAYLCQDLLSTEKYVSHAYDTGIFEFTNSNVRDVLNHIQKEEQQHGEQLFNYMQQNGMYNPQ